LSSLPKDAAISYQASRVRSKRLPVPAFEPGIVFGTRVETIKFFCPPKLGKNKIEPERNDLHRSDANFAKYSGTG
jgi:hypothetical protein